MFLFDLENCSKNRKQTARRLQMWKAFKQQHTDCKPTVHTLLHSQINTLQKMILITPCTYSTTNMNSKM